MKITKANYKDSLTYLITSDDESSALWKIINDEPCWTNRIEFAWHSPDLEKVKEIFNKLTVVNNG